MPLSLILIHVSAAALVFVGFLRMLDQLRKAREERDDALRDVEYQRSERQTMADRARSAEQAKYKWRERAVKLASDRAMVWEAEQD